MEYVLVWILVFAGATIGLLATFLIASERELRVQQDEAASRTAAAESVSERITAVDISQNPVVEEHAAVVTGTHATDDAELGSQLAKLQTWLADAQARNFEIDAAYHKVDEEAAHLRGQLAQIQKELEAHSSAAERWLEAGQTLSEIMSKRATSVKNNEDFDQALMRLAALLNEAAPSEIAESNGSSYGPIQNGETERPKVNGVDNGGSFHELETTKSDAPIGAAGSETLWQKNRGGIVAIGVFLLIIGALGTQAWRLRPTLSANEGVSREAERPTEPTDGQSQANSTGDVNRATADTQVVKSPTARASRKFSRDGDTNLQPSAPLLKKASFTTPRTALKPKLISQKSSSSPYAAIRPGRVYKEPDEKSAAVGKIEAGMEVLVVNANSGWLEIRSKHGRAPGFIRSDIAVPQTAQ